MFRPCSDNVSALLGPRPAEDIDDLPDFDVFVQHQGDQHYPAHWHPGTGEFGIGQHDAHEMLASREVVANHPPDATLPSSYEAVH